MPRLPDFRDQLQRISNGDPWYGDSIQRLTGDLTAGEAGARPIPGAHSIWELVLHITSWAREIQRRLTVGKWQMPADGDWPASPEPTTENWRAALAALHQAHEELAATLRTWPETRLDEQVGQERNPALGTGVTFAQMLHGLLQHDAYHTGQIGLLRKVVRGKQ
jgi:uncharacterized damage-inducible protein DinB